MSTKDEGLAKDTTVEKEDKGAPVSAGPCSLLTWPLGNLASLLTGICVFVLLYLPANLALGNLVSRLIGVPHLPEGTHFRWNITTMY